MAATPTCGNPVRTPAAASTGASRAPRGLPEQQSRANIFPLQNITCLGKHAVQKRVRKSTEHLGWWCPPQRFNTGQAGAANTDGGLVVTPAKEPRLSSRPATVLRMYPRVRNFVKISQAQRLLRVKLRTQALTVRPGATIPSPMRHAHMYSPKATATRGHWWALPCTPRLSMPPAIAPAHDSTLARRPGDRDFAKDP